MQRLPESLEGATWVVGGNYLNMSMGPDSSEERWPENVDTAQAVGEVAWLRVLRGPRGQCAVIAQELLLRYKDMVLSFPSYIYHL